MVAQRRDLANRLQITKLSAQRTEGNSPSKPGARADIKKRPLLIGGVTVADEKVEQDYLKERLGQLQSG